MATLRTRYGVGPLVVAAAIPFLFLHRHYQPSFGIGSVDADLSDLAVLAVVLTAAARLRPRRPAVAWAGWAALVAMVLLSTAWGAARFAAYPAGTHAVTAAKWLEYMLLAPALVLIVRSARGLEPAAVVLVAWSCLASLVGGLQFFGALGDLDHTPPGYRKASFVGVHDFAALSAAALLIGVLIVCRGSRSARERHLAVAALVAGPVGMVIAGPLDTLTGAYLAIASLVLVTRVRDARRLLTVAGVVIAITLGVAFVRSSALSDGLKFLGLGHGTGGASTHIQSYRQRVLLAYIGVRIFEAHPVLGVGFQGSSDPYAFEPYLAAARSRFDQPPEAFPSPSRRWGVQNAYVQSLADMGVPGLVAFLAALLVPAWLAARRGGGDLRAIGLALPLLVLGVWNGYGLVAGIPLDALTWLGVSVAIVAASGPEAQSA